MGSPSRQILLIPCNLLVYTNILVLVLPFLFSPITPFSIIYKGKGVPKHAEVAQGVPGRLRPRIFLTFGTTRVIGLQPYAPAAFTPGEIPGTRF